MYPLEGFLNNFSSEVASTFNDVKSAQGKLLKDELLRARIRELALAWNIQVPQNEIIFQRTEAQKISAKLSEVAVLSNKLTQKQKYYPAFRDIIQNLNLFSTSAKTDFALAALPNKTQGRLVAQINDLPTEIFPEALIGRKGKMEEFLKKFPFDNNVFVIVRYAKESTETINAVKNALNSFEKNDQRFNAIIARDVEICDDLYNPIACLLCCKYAVVIFDSVETKAEINPNVAYELGFMHLLQRKCLILKDSQLKSLNSDILHKLYQSYTTPNEASEITTRWLANIVS